MHSLPGMEVMEVAFPRIQVDSLLLNIAYVLMAIAFLVTTALSARKAGAGAPLIWVGGIFMSLFPLMSTVRSLAMYMLTMGWHGGDSSTFFATIGTISMLISWVQVILLSAGVLLLMRGSVKAARTAPTAAVAPFSAPHPHQPAPGPVPPPPPAGPSAPFSPWPPGTS